MIFHAAHLPRAIVLSEFIDPSVLDDSDPDVREAELDLYDPRIPNQPPYSADFISRFRAARLARVRRRTRCGREISAAGNAWQTSSRFTSRPEEE